MEDWIEIHGGKRLRIGDSFWRESPLEGWIECRITAIYERRGGTLCVESQWLNSLFHDWSTSPEEWLKWRDSAVTFGMKLDETLRGVFGNAWVNPRKGRDKAFNALLDLAARRFMDSVKFWEIGGERCD